MRFANLLHHNTGEPRYCDMAEHAMRYLATPEVYNFRLGAGILSADRELQRASTHLAIVGSKQESTAKALYHAALRVPGWYKRIDWWDRAEGPLPNTDIECPVLKLLAAFVCTENRCSTPIFKAEELAAALAFIQSS